MPRLAALLLVLLVSPGIAPAHHSVAGFSNPARQVVIEVGRHWDWRPEIQVGAYECQKDQQLQQ